MSKIAIFLGAGASKAEGAPLQTELFREYFKRPGFRGSPDEMDRELATFFYLMFGIDVDNGNLDIVKFPTFEEVLGLTDLAILRKEAFRDFDLENRASNSGRLRFIAQYLVFLMAKLLGEKLETSLGLHQKLVDKLFKADVLKDVIFISTNYDILIDNAISEKYGEGIDLDYGVDFVNFEKGDWRRPRQGNAVCLFKPHGSLNWLYCPTCNCLELTPNEKGVVKRLITDFRKAPCPYCGSIYMPIIVPPSYYKDMSNIFLSTIWNKCENKLRDVQQIVFCGYSFPDADMHIKYLLKRVQVNSMKKFKVTVINHHKGKLKRDKVAEAERYERFFSPIVTYTKKTFEQFARNPISFIDI